MVCCVSIKSVAGKEIEIQNAEFGVRISECRAGERFYRRDRGGRREIENGKLKMNSTAEIAENTEEWEIEN